MAIESTTSLPPASDRIGVGRIAFGIAAIWLLVHAAVYFGVVYCRLKFLCDGNLKFSNWQAAGFFGLAVFTAVRCPAAAGRLLLGYLACSTLVVLAFSQDAAMVLRLAVLLLWMACAVAGMRQAMARWVGRQFATYGVAAAAVFAAMVPIGFVLGVLQAITPSIVATVAVATALPGAIFWLRAVADYAMGQRTNQPPAAEAPPCDTSADALATSQGRLRPFPPQAVLGPTFTSGFAGPIPLNGQARSRASWLSRIRKHGTHPASVPATRKPWTVFEFCLFEVIWLVLAIEFIGASTSQLDSDSIRVHLPYMLRVAADHGLSHQYACWHRLELMAVQTYGAVLISVGSIVVAQWFSWLALAALVLLVGEEVRRRSDSRLAGLFAGAAVLSCPVLVRLSKTLSVDHVVALLCTAGFVVLFRALRPPSLRGILFSAAIVASMVQVKNTGLICCVVWCLFLGVWLLRTRGWAAGLRWLAVAAAVLLALAAPWYVYVYLGTGNPFYPCLNGWFPSPNWPAGLTYQQILQSENFKLPFGIAGISVFPWVATYHTTSFVEGYDGFLGCAAIALAPCLFFAWRRGAVAYWEMAAAAVAMIVGTVVYTPYVRYWMPAYPLLVAACVLAAASLIDAHQWRPKGRPLLLAVVGAAALLLLPLPLIGGGTPWDAYAKRMSAEDHLKKWFHEYDAVQQLNAILAPHDGVLCTGCNGVYLLGGRPYEFAFWWNKVHRVHDRDSFADFCRRNEIRYWIVDRSSPMSQPIRGSEPIVAEYWSDARLVAASGTVAVYDVASPHGDCPNLRLSGDCPNLRVTGDCPNFRISENGTVPLGASKIKTAPIGGQR